MHFRFVYLTPIWTLFDCLVFFDETVSETFFDTIISTKQHHKDKIKKKLNPKTTNIQQLLYIMYKVIS